MLRRTLQGFLLGLLLFLLLGGLLLTAAYVLSDGQVVRSAQDLLLRLQLSNRQAELRAPYSGDTRPQRFQVPAGAGASAIAADLVAAGLIRDGALFVDYARVEGYDRRFEAGVYFIKRSQSTQEIAELLTDSSRSFIPLRVLEGSRIEELAEAVDRSGLFGFRGEEMLALVGRGAAIPADFAAWAGIPAGSSLEGFLFPDSYQLPPEVDAVALRDMLLQNFRERVGDELQAAAAAQGLSLFQAVTLASIIEREAVWRDEHARIASVYRNRLAIDMRLEADPTVQYALQGKRDSWWPPITQADYRAVESPYNSYLYGGYPPGPIASPSLSAIQAAIEPEATDFFYFRARCDGSLYHNFARGYEEHVGNAC